MADEHDTDRWKYIRGLHFEYADFYDLLGTAVVAVFVILFIRAIFPPDGSDFDMNLTTEIISIVVTIVVIDRRNGRRELRRYQRQLIDDAASISNEIARNALHQIRRKNWIMGESSILQGIVLSEAALKGANFNSANLAWSNFAGANLQQASFAAANLTGTFFQGAKMQKALLTHANLEDANLAIADLSGAVLKNANLEGIYAFDLNLRGANLEGANFKNARLDNVYTDENTILPSGERASIDVDMSKFTNPSHPEFWRSDNRKSPAYRQGMQYWLEHYRSVQEYRY